MLAVLGGGFASALLFGGPAVLAWAFNFYGPELDLFKPDAWMVLQCVALCFVTSVMLRLLPALRFSRPSILSALKNDASGSGRRVGRLQRLTAAAQAGLAVPLLVIGGIKLDQARVSAMTELGFAPHGLYAAKLNLSAIGQSAADRQVFLRTVQENLRQAPGIVSVSVGDGVPLDFNARDTRVARERESSFGAAHTTRIGVGYLETVGIRLLSGRTIDANDRAEAERVVVLSEPLARQLFPAGNPLGERVIFALKETSARPTPWWVSRLMWSRRRWAIRGRSCSFPSRSIRRRRCWRSRAAPHPTRRCSAHSTTRSPMRIPTSCWIERAPSEKVT